MKKLLIIEDDPQWAAVLERYALEAGYLACVWCLTRRE